MVSPLALACAGGALLGAVLLAAAVATAHRLADPCRCHRCRRAITPGNGLCATCFDRWRKGQSR